MHQNTDFLLLMNMTINFQFSVQNAAVKQLQCYHAILTLIMAAVFTSMATAQTGLSGNNADSENEFLTVATMLFHFHLKRLS